MSWDNRIFSERTCDFSLNGQLMVELVYYSYVVIRQRGISFVPARTQSAVILLNHALDGASQLCVFKSWYIIYSGNTLSILYWSYVRRPFSM